MVKKHVNSAIPQTPRLLRQRPVEVQLDKLGLAVFESFHAPNFSMDLQSYEYHKVALVLAGRGDLDLGNERRPLEARHFVFLPAGSAHRFCDHPDANLGLIIACFRETALQESREVLALFTRHFPALQPVKIEDDYRHGLALAALRNLILEQSRREPCHGTAMAAELALLLIILGRTQAEMAERAVSAGRQRFLASLSFLERNFQRRVRIPDLAAMAGMSYRGYCAAFRRHTGLSVHRQLTRLRLAFARERLGESHNVLYAALESGFGDLSSFYRAFRKEHGTTPRRFLKSAVELQS